MPAKSPFQAIRAVDYTVIFVIASAAKQSRGYEKGWIASSPPFLEEEELSSSQ